MHMVVDASTIPSVVTLNMIFDTICICLYFLVLNQYQFEDKTGSCFCPTRVNVLRNNGRYTTYPEQYLCIFRELQI